MAKKTPLAERLDEVRSRIEAAAKRAKRDPKEITLIAVTKNASPEAIKEIVQLGITDLGESRVQQIIQRASLSNEMEQRRRIHGDADPSAPIIKPKWHMIGHLQRNKVKQVLPLVYCVHSIDSLRLAEDIDLAAGKLGLKSNVMLQINASEEPQKFGVAIGAALHLGEQIATMDNVQLIGLMTMAEHTDNETTIRNAFRRTREVFDEMVWQKVCGPAFRHVSMGMSGDYELAIEEGSTMVRVGSALFGEATVEETPEE